MFSQSQQKTENCIYARISVLFSLLNLHRWTGMGGAVVRSSSVDSKAYVEEFRPLRIPVQTISFASISFVCIPKLLFFCYTLQQKNMTICFINGENICD